MRLIALVVVILLSVGAWAHAEGVPQFSSMPLGSCATVDGVFMTEEDAQRLLTTLSETAALEDSLVVCEQALSECEAQECESVEPEDATCEVTEEQVVEWKSRPFAFALVAFLSFALGAMLFAQRRP